MVPAHPRRAASRPGCRNVADHGGGEHHVGGARLKDRLTLGRIKRLAEGGGKGGAVRHVVKAERTDQPVQLQRIDAGAKQVRRLAALTDIGKLFDDQAVELGHDLGFAQIGGVVDVLDHHQPNEMRRPDMSVASLFLLYSAHGISGFEALSGPGAVPMATTFVMLVAALLVTVRTARLPNIATETLARDILPPMVILFIGFLIVFGLLLKPLGFVPTAAFFLTIAIRVLTRRGWG